MAAANNQNKAPRYILNSINSPSRYTALVGYENGLDLEIHEIIDQTLYKHNFLNDHGLINHFAYNQRNSAVRITAAQQSQISVPRPLAEFLQAEATLAVSLEPPGGSPTGQPTGPVIAAGKLQKI